MLKYLTKVFVALGVVAAIGGATIATSLVTTNDAHACYWNGKRYC